jgi:hypothetical protein
MFQVNSVYNDVSGTRIVTDNFCYSSALVTTEQQLT